MTAVVTWQTLSKQEGVREIRWDPILADHLAD